MKQRFTLIVLLVLLSSLMHSMPVKANFSVDVYIDAAWYADLDGDLYEDDIQVDLSATLYNSYVYTDIDLYIGITLPSGLEHWFLASFTIQKYTYSKSFSMTFELYDTATESGWYEASAVGFAEGDSFSFMDTLIFDPPGSNGGNPSGVYYFT